MTTQADQKDRTGRSRRQLLAGGTGALAAVLAAEAIARPAPAYAGTDGDVVLGAPNSTAGQTIIKNITAGAVAFQGDATGNGTGLRGTSDSAPGVQGSSTTGFGLFGISTSGEGLYAQSGNSFGSSLGRPNGVHAVTNSSGDSGVWGENVASPGGYGVVGTTNGPLPAVFGEQLGSGNGVRGQSPAGIGVLGTAGGIAISNSAGEVGVYGASQHNWGVAALSVTGTGLQAQSFGGTGVVGVGTSTGVYGQSGPTNGFALTRDGVRGFTDSSAASGVRGQNANGGNGVSGVTTSSGSLGAAAVDGTNAGSGPGVRGTGGIGVQAAGAIALDVQGSANFSRSGKLTIPAGKISATKTGVSLTSASIVLATPQNNIAGAAVRSAVPNVAGSSFTVHLAKAVSKAVTIGWFIVN